MPYFYMGCECPDCKALIILEQRPGPGHGAIGGSDLSEQVYCQKCDKGFAKGQFKIELWKFDKPQDLSR